MGPTVTADTKKRLTVTQRLKSRSKGSENTSKMQDSVFDKHQHTKASSKASRPSIQASSRAPSRASGRAPSRGYTKELCKSPGHRKPVRRQAGSCSGARDSVYSRSSGFFTWRELSLNSR